MERAFLASLVPVCCFGGLGGWGLGIWVFRVLGFRVWGFRGLGCGFGVCGLGFGFGPLTLKLKPEQSSRLRASGFWGSRPAGFNPNWAQGLGL